MTDNTGTKQVSTVARLSRWVREDFMGLVREMRLSYLPPLMVYSAAGISGFTGIVESFFVKKSLGLSPAFLADLAFWAGLPWAMKMPLGHLVDLFWRRKSFFVYAGAALMAVSLLVMVGLTGYTDWMRSFLPVETWYILSVLVAPIGYVMQDVVADAMTVEAVPTRDEDGNPFPEKELQRMHVTMQTMGRVAIVGGSALVAGAGGWLAETFSYATMYKISLVIPVISVLGVALAAILRWRKRRREQWQDYPAVPGTAATEKTKVDWTILGGGAAFVIVSVILGLSNVPLKEEIIFSASMGIILFLMAQVLKDISAEKRREIVSIAVIIFVFRAMPTYGAGASWWQIDVLGFDEAFFGTMRQVASILAIVGMFILRGWMAKRSVPYLVAFLAIYNTVMTLPFIGMYYGLHHWTAAHFGFGARAIAIIDTMADSPLGQVAMIPMLAWIAREAPQKQKATYFAVMAAFTNLALSASQLGTTYLNEIFHIARGQYGELGHLMITVTAISFVLPVAAVALFTPHRKKRIPEVGHPSVTGG